LEEVVYAGTILDLTGELKDDVSLESESKNVNSSLPELSEDMLDFQEDILESLI
jgi:hypothetical protein